MDINASTKVLLDMQARSCRTSVDVSVRYHACLMDKSVRANALQQCNNCVHLHVVLLGLIWLDRLDRASTRTTRT